jgi:Zn-dependent peptidase ImmA (M78 family)
MTRSEEDELVAWARLCGDLLACSALKVRWPGVLLPRLGNTSLPDAANRTRVALGLTPDQPVPHVIRTLERVGVALAVLEFDAELHARHHDAFSTWIGETMERPLVVARASASWERTRLSVAHELGHLVMHRTRRAGDLEAEAFAFAAEFLLPSEQLRIEWPARVTPLSLLPLKRRWGMSLSSLIEHGYRQGLVSGPARVNLYKQLSNRRNPLTGERWRTQEPGANDREPERPKLLAKAIEIAYGSDASLGKISQASCHWPPRFLRVALAGQATPWSGEVSGRRAATAAVEQAVGDRERVVSLADRLQVWG